MDKNELVKIKIKAEGGLPGRFWHKEYEFDLKNGQIKTIEFTREGCKWVPSSENSKPISFSYELLEECFERVCKILSSPTKEAETMILDSFAELTFVSLHSRMKANVLIHDETDSVLSVLYTLYTLMG